VDEPKQAQSGFNSYFAKRAYIKPQDPTKKEEAPKQEDPLAVSKKLLLKD
jgi:hypothetical protein